MQDTLPFRIANRIVSEYIESGRVCPGERLPTVRELQAQYGVAHSTIVHAIGILDMQGIIKKHRGVGCYVAEKALSPNKVEMKMMGFIAAAGADEELVMRSYRGASVECERHGYHMSFSTSGGSYEVERQEVYRMFEVGYKGVVLFPATRTQKQLKEDYLKNELQDFPIVLVDLAYPEQKRSQVVFDNYTAGYDMTEMLINKGHKRIAFMEANLPDGDYMQKSILERYQGYMDAMRNNHLTPRPEDHWIIYHRISKEETYDGLMSKLADCLHKWLDDECPPSALLALEDLTASCITSLARELGINMPSQLEVVGFDNLRVGKSCIPPFSTTNPDFTCAGKIAARTAIRQIEGIQTTVPIIQVLPVPLKIRSSAEVESITECVR